MYLEMYLQKWVAGEDTTTAMLHQNAFISTFTEPTKVDTDPSSCNGGHTCVSADVENYCHKLGLSIQNFTNALADCVDNIPLEVKARTLQMIVECRVTDLTLDHRYGIYIPENSQVKELLQKLLDTDKADGESSVQRRTLLVLFAHLVAHETARISDSLEAEKRNRRQTRSEGKPPGKRGRGAKYKAYQHLLGVGEQDLENRTVEALNAHLEVGKALTFMLQTLPTKFLGHLPGYTIQHPELQFEKASLCFKLLKDEIRAAE